MTKLLDHIPDDDANALTPGRRTIAAFDVEQKVCTEDGWRGVRVGPEIAPVAASQKGADSPYSRHMILHSSGCWSLRSLQEDFALTREKPLPDALNQQFIFTPTTDIKGSGLKAILVDALVQETWQSPYGNGLVNDPVSPDTWRDPFYRRVIGAAGRWINEITPLPASVSAMQPAIEADRGLPLQQVLLCIFESVTEQPADQGFCIRWEVPGTGNSTYDVLMVMHFGQYGLAVYGNGEAALWEYARPFGNSGGAYSWSKRKTFRYSKPNLITGQTHTLIIWPASGPNKERIIHFRNTDLEAAESAASGVLSTPSHSLRVTSSTSKEILYRPDEAVTNGYDESPGHVTASAKLRIQQRADIRMLWQISRLVYPTLGSIGDQPWSTPTQSTPRPYTVRMVKEERAGTSITATLRDANNPSITGSAVKSPQVQFDFASDGTDTPILWQYAINRDPVIQTITPGVFDTSNQVSVQRIEVNGAGGDPRQESASLHIHDPFNRMPRLRKRSELSARITTSYLPHGETTPVKVVLFRGHAVRPHTERYGRSNSPYPEWRGHSVVMAGEWHRLSQYTVRNGLTFKPFMDDPTATGKTGSEMVPWKATDVIRYLLQMCGFPPSQIRIADNPIRLFPIPGGGANDGTLTLGANGADFAINVAEQYLGQCLIFDANGGPLDSENIPMGEWTIISPPKGDPASGYYPDGPLPTPVFHFVKGLSIQPISGYKLPVPSSYPLDTVATIGRRESYFTEPEMNHFILFGAPDTGRNGGVRIQNHVYNFKSYKVPGSTIDPDPDSPHYIGREVLAVNGDPTIWGGSGPTSYQDTQTITNFLLRRYFNRAMLAREIQPVHAPLVFIKDANYNRYRPLRMYDPVSLDGTNDLWYVRSCSPSYAHDRNQTADYELERTVPY